MHSWLKILFERERVMIINIVTANHSLQRRIENSEAIKYLLPLFNISVAMDDIMEIVWATCW